MNLEGTSDINQNHEIFSSKEKLTFRGGETEARTRGREMAMKSALKAIRERGLGTFFRELKEEGFLFVSLFHFFDFTIE